MIADADFNVDLYHTWTCFLRGGVTSSALLSPGTTLCVSPDPLIPRESVNARAGSLHPRVPPHVLSEHPLCTPHAPLTPLFVSPEAPTAREAP